MWKNIKKINYDMCILIKKTLYNKILEYNWLAVKKKGTIKRPSKLKEWE